MIASLYLALVALVVGRTREEEPLELTEVYDPFDGYHNPDDFGDWC